MKIFQIHNETIDYLFLMCGNDDHILNVSYGIKDLCVFFEFRDDLCGNNLDILHFIIDNFSAFDFAINFELTFIERNRQSIVLIYSLHYKNRYHLIVICQREVIGAILNSIILVWNCIFSLKICPAISVVLALLKMVRKKALYHFPPCNF